MKSSRLLLPALAWLLCLALAQAKDSSLPSQAKALSALKLSGFTEPPVQIPATVVDVGILSYVPYSSFRVGTDRELNIYGDASAPACVEIGLYRSLLNSEEEKRRCVSFVKRIFPSFDPRSIRLSGGKFMTGGLVVEITPPEATDSYGAWWISIYSLALIHDAAGTSASVSIVSVAKNEAVSSGVWTESEISLARNSPTSSRESKKSERVYDRDVTIKAYTRKNGTFVPAHTRSK